MLPVLRGKAVRSLCSLRMSIAGTVAWHQSPTTALSSLPRSLNVHAAVFVPRLRAANPSTGALGANRSADNAAHHSADLYHFRPALPPTNSPCSTSGRDSLTQHTPSIQRRAADFGHRSAAAFTCLRPVLCATFQLASSQVMLQIKRYSNMCRSCKRSTRHAGSRLYCRVQDRNEAGARAPSATKWQNQLVWNRC